MITHVLDQHSLLVLQKPVNLSLVFSLILDKEKRLVESYCVSVTTKNNFIKGSKINTGNSLVIDFNMEV